MYSSPMRYIALLSLAATQLASADLFSDLPVCAVSQVYPQVSVVDASCPMMLSWSDSFYLLVEYAERDHLRGWRHMMFTDFVPPKTRLI